jgi:hypothetical protein
MKTETHRKRFLSDGVDKLAAVSDVDTIRDTDERRGGVGEGTGSILEDMAAMQGRSEVFGWCEDECRCSGGAGGCVVLARAGVD